MEFRTIREDEFHAFERRLPQGIDGWRRWWWWNVHAWLQPMSRVSRGAPNWARQEDAAGAIEGVGWKSEHVGYVNVSGMGQATGILDNASLRVQGFYLFRRPE